MININDILSYMDKYGYLFLAGIVFLEYLNLPGLPAGIIMPAAGILIKSRGLNFPFTLITSVIAGLLGSWCLYAIGYYCGNPIIDKIDVYKRQVYDDINLHIKNVRKWAKEEKRKSPIIYYPSKSYVYKEPYGVTLIIGPFNYPFQLVISPLIGAISAGNTAIIKPSENTKNVALLLEKMINENFNEAYLKVVNPLGGKEVVSTLLDLPFDYIFFTGSVRVGKIVMEKAAKYLTPITLELGGKSPCIVDSDAKLNLAAKRLSLIHISIPTTRSILCAISSVGRAPDS